MTLQDCRIKLVNLLSYSHVRFADETMSGTTTAAQRDALATNEKVKECFTIFRESSQKCVSEVPTAGLTYTEVRTSLINIVKQLAYEATKFALVMKGDLSALEKESSEQICGALGSAAQKVATVSLLVGACGACDALRNAVFALALRSLKAAENLLASVGDDAKVRYQ